MTVRLRAHHLLCLLTYVGKGYTPAFTANYDGVAQRLSQGEDIVIVAGPDDICAPLLLEREQHCWNDSVVERDRQSAADVTSLLHMSEPIGVGARLVLEHEAVARMRHSFAGGGIRQACGGCEWSSLCSSVSASGYDGVHLAPGRLFNPRPLP